MAPDEMSNREKWTRVAYDFGGGRRLATVILRADTTLWKTVNAYLAVHSIMFYAAAFPEGPPDVAE